MSCPDETTWSSYLRGAIEGAAADELRAHLDTCATCRSAAARASAGDAPISSPLNRLVAQAASPVIAFKEADPATTAVTVRPSGDDEPPRPAVTLVPSGDDE